MDTHNRGNKNEITVAAHIGNLGTVTDFINGMLTGYGCPNKTIIQIDIIIDELFSNIAYYAYPNVTGDVTVGIEIIREQAPAAVITFTDCGIPYNPLERDNPDTTLSARERKIGGLGIFIVRKNVDDISYEYAGGRNILRIKRRFDAQGKPRG